MTCTGGHNTLAANYAGRMKVTRYLRDDSGEIVGHEESCTACGVTYIVKYARPFLEVKMKREWVRSQACRMGVRR